MVEGINTDIIKKFEGFSDKAYLCPADVWTIGYGSTRFKGKPVVKGLTCTREEAETQLQLDVQEFANGVKKLVAVDININQLSALVSFAYNVGLNNLKKSTLLKLVNAGKFAEAANEFGKWVNAAGKKLPGLVTRREAEKQLFQKVI